MPRVTSQLCFLPQGPAWGSKDKCFTKMYTMSGECCKACNLGEGVVQPCGVNQTVCEPCLDSEYLLPPHQGCWAQGGLWGPPAGAGVLPVCIPLGELHGCTLCCSLQPPGAQFLHKCTQMAGFLPGFPPNPSAICPANPNPRSNNHPVPGPAGARHVCRSPSRALSPSSPPALPSKTHPHRGHPASHLYHC